MGQTKTDAKVRYAAIDVANFFIQLTNSIADDAIDNLKINKLLYYVQGICLAQT